MRTVVAMVLAIVLLAGVGQSARAVNPTIDVMYTTSDMYAYQPTGNKLQILGAASWYSLSDGSFWSSGAGSYYVYFSGAASSHVVAGTITYALDLPAGSLIYQQTDWDAGNHSAQGTLATTAPLTLHANKDSSTATLSGYADLVSNDMTSYGLPKFNFYSASVGELVPFTVTYTLLGGRTWQEDTFSTSFNYELAGVVRFVDAVPEPATLPLLVLGGLILARRRRA